MGKSGTTECHQGEPFGQWASYYAFVIVTKSSKLLSGEHGFKIHTSQVKGHAKWTEKLTE